MHSVAISMYEVSSEQGATHFVKGTSDRCINKKIGQRYPRDVKQRYLVRSYEWLVLYWWSIYWKNL